MRIKVRARTRFLVVGCESGIYVAPVESNGAVILFFSNTFLVYSWTRNFISDGISIDIELFAPHLAGGTVNVWAENV